MLTIIRETSLCSEKYWMQIFMAPQKSKIKTAESSSLNKTFKLLTLRFREHCGRKDRKNMSHKKSYKISSKQDTVTMNSQQV